MSISFISFYQKQSQVCKNKYQNLIKGVSQLSALFTDSEKPYLPYRAVEKMFCKAFDASDKSRQDVSVDAVKIKDGIGVKTFVCGNGLNKMEKVAEFVDRKRYPFDHNNTKMIMQVIEYRNNRILDTRKAFSLDNTVYHYLVRAVGKIHICECPMLLIDKTTVNFKSIAVKDNIVRFKDQFFNYYFHLSKHTLYQSFDYGKPFDTILTNDKMDSSLLNATLIEFSNKGIQEKKLIDTYEYVLLPLYSTRTGEVPERSGLNQWNASGRKRDFNEVYILFPA